METEKLRSSLVKTNQTTGKKRLKFDASETVTDFINSKEPEKVFPFFNTLSME